MSAFAATLRHRVAIYLPNTVKDPGGQKVSGRALFDTRWADIAILNGLESIKAGAVTSKRQASIRFRFCQDLTSAMEFEHGGVVYKAKSILPDLRSKRHTDVACEVEGG